MCTLNWPSIKTNRPSLVGTVNIRIPDWFGIWMVHFDWYRAFEYRTQKVRFSNGFNKMAAFYHLKTEFQKCPKNDHLNTGRSGIQMFTVFSQKSERYWLAKHCFRANKVKTKLSELVKNSGRNCSSCLNPNISRVCKLAEMYRFLPLKCLENN
jgi:hypothetical protein